MQKNKFLLSIEPRFRQPEGLVWKTYFPSKRGRVRYVHSKSREEIAQVVFCGGLGQFIEMDFEMIRDLNRIGISIWWLERFGEGGSQRQFKDRQKPPVLMATELAKDLLEFIELITPDIDKKKPFFFMGSCFGGLVGLHSCILKSSIFDSLFLVSPMLGLIWSNGAEHEWVWTSADETENKYVGKAQNWSWKLAQRLMEREQTTHDRRRGSLIHLWRKQFPRLRLGGFTYPSVKAFSWSVIALFEPAVLESITTPVTIVSPELDVVNDIRRHELAAQRLPNGKHIQIAGAYHGLWREADAYRNQLLHLVQDEVQNLRFKYETNYQKG